MQSCFEGEKSSEQIRTVGGGGRQSAEGGHQFFYLFSILYSLLFKELPHTRAEAPHSFRILSLRLIFFYAVNGDLIDPCCPDIICTAE